MQKTHAKNTFVMDERNEGTEAQHRLDYILDQTRHYAKRETV